MKTIKFILTLFIAFSFVYSQGSKNFIPGKKEKSTEGVPKNDLSKTGIIDCKIINSTSAYIEIEFYPAGVSAGKIYYKNESFDVFDFSSSASYDITNAGEPDLRYRIFNIALPSALNNTVQLLDYDVKEINNIYLAPVPGARLKDPSSRSFDNVYFSYSRGPAYTQNKFIPENIAVLEKPGKVRELTTAGLKIFPFQYNPVTGVIRFYSRVRVRVDFGYKPLPFNRIRSRQETELLQGIALNSDLALNWLDPMDKNAGTARSVTPSVLSAGNWYKIEIKDYGDDGKSEGIYKITKGYLDSAGISTAGIDPRKMKMYGNGGFILPEKHEADRPGDLQEIAIYIEGENDGIFNAQDYILFYAASINKWHYDTIKGCFQHFLNYYSRSNYYWLCFNTPNNGKRMTRENSASGIPVIAPASFTEKLFSESEVSNLLNEGNLWFSAGVSSGGSFYWNLILKGLQFGSDILYRIKPASRCLSPYDNHMLIKDDYSVMPELYFQMGNVYTGFGYWIWTKDTSFIINQSQKTNGELVKLRASYISNSIAAIGYMDWWEIQYKRRFSSAENDF